MIHLRKLEIRDIPLMLEWMHDPSVVENMHANFLSKKAEDCKKFVSDSWTDSKNLHLAIADESDIYQGTVSLKDIHDKTAEFAIAIRTAAMGKGYSIRAMKEIIQIGFTQLGLNSVFWYVSPENKRAVRFYDKNGYVRVSPKKLSFLDGRFSDTMAGSFLWYLVSQ